MPSWDDRESRLVSKKIAVLLAELGFFSNLRKKDIRFNPRPSPNSKSLSNKAKKVEEENVIDLHLEIVKEIDDLLERHEVELQRREPDPLFKTQQTLHLQEFVEMRNPEIRKTELPQFPTEFGLKNVYGELKPNGEIFEVEVPTQNQFELEKKEGYNRDLNNWMMGEKDKKYSMSLSQIKEKGNSPAQKETKTEKTGMEMNGLTKTKIELERTKKEIEERRRALEEAEKLEKEKEEELKIITEEKKKEEKLKKLEIRRKLKEKHLREKEQEKAQRQKEKELRRLEQEKLKQEKQSQLEQGKLEKEKEKELKKLEKEKLEKENQEKKELKILQEEKEKLEKLKEKEEKLKQKKPEKEKVEEVIEVVPPEMDIFIQKESKDETPHLDNDVEKLLPILDKLLEKLPDEIVDEFANSENFALYEKVMTKYKRK